ncbi:hypothetical protein LWI28_004170 [Acer negundo]|uniref:Myb/SANT-like domain-containing protein n=1 Tax=Acer negundo TaxID=4023 RepID=A0AAD5P6K5_ACENE|nr:hypothetical protein LWI28_004170 [Acer negundo]
MDDRLTDALYTQHAQGNRVDGNFTSKAYENIVLELSEKLGVDIDRDKVKNLKKIWSAEPEVWENLLETNPSAKKSAGAETAKEKRKCWDNGSGDDYEILEGIDKLLSQNEITLESVAHMDDYMDTMVSP